MLPVIGFERTSISPQMDILIGEDTTIVFDDFPAAERYYLLAATLRGIGLSRDGELKLFDSLTLVFRTGSTRLAWPGIGFVDDKITKFVRPILVEQTDNPRVEVDVLVRGRRAADEARVRVILWLLQEKIPS